MRPTISPVIWYRDPRAALAWLEKAFGFETTLVVDDGQGEVIHSETVLEGGMVMVVGPPRDKAATPIAFGGRATQSIHVQLAAGLDAARLRAFLDALSPQLLRAKGVLHLARAIAAALGEAFGQTVVVLSPDEQAKATGHDIATSL